MIMRDAANAVRRRATAVTRGVPAGVACPPARRAVSAASAAGAALPGRARSMSRPSSASTMACDTISRALGLSSARHDTTAPGPCWSPRCNGYARMYSAPPLPLAQVVGAELPALLRSSSARQERARCSSSKRAGRTSARGCRCGTGDLRTDDRTEAPFPDTAVVERLFGRRWPRKISSCTRTMSTSS